ncbi:hypothetical protein CLOM_g22418 [Closterium sp. NIES-68]|nr:hypothetical protein CLOM_g22418 [Closterium sp. NIES-68]GJP63595.1 hypothetical protein CLOP_g20664 [Closterium sp. NIES-67]GJP70239.1 hypothetical protein CLOP_g1204 [Closterium sp. NIES-67]
MAIFKLARETSLLCHGASVLAAVALAHWMLACHVSAQPGPITFRIDPRRSNLTWDSEIPPKEGQLASVVVIPGGFPLAGTITVDVVECTDIRTSFNVTKAAISNTSITGITPGGRPAPASIIAQANATGAIAASGPTLNLSTSEVPPFDVDQTYGTFQSVWTVPTATWRSVKGFFAPSRDFGGGPFAASNLSAPLASFGFVNGQLSTIPGNQSRVDLVINSTAVFTARQLLLTANAAASIMNIVMGQGHVRMRIILRGVADNPCAVAPTLPPSPRSRP